MDQQITVKDALVMVVERLGKLKIPIDLFEEVTVPVKECSEMIKECVRSIDRVEAEAKAKAEEKGEADA